MKQTPVLPPFKGTKEQENHLLEFIHERRAQRGGLMPVLQYAQEIYGYLPIEVQKIVAEGLNVSLSEVYGVATFYSQFSLVPKGDYRISICLGTACYVKGADKILEAIEREVGVESGGCTPDGRFSIDAARCIGACGLAPVIMINDDVYGRLSTADIPAIIDTYRKKKLFKGDDET